MRQRYIKFVVTPSSFSHSQNCTWGWQTGHGDFWWLATLTATKSYVQCHTLGKFLQRFPLTTGTYCIQYVHIMSTWLWEWLVSFVRTFSMCKFTSNAFWKCVWVCLTGDVTLSPHSRKYLGWFPSECLGVPMECPLSTDSPLQLLTVSPFCLLGGGRWHDIQIRPPILSPQRRANGQTHNLWKSSRETLFRC